MEGPGKILHDDGISRGVPQTPQPVHGAKLDSRGQAAAAKTQGTDRVELSDRARALLVASSAIDNTEQIRTDKVESLKQLIKNGEYRVPGEKIAERLLGEGIFA